MARVIFDQVTKRYAGNVEAVKDLNMEIEDNEFLVLVGPSGCGKSTAMRMVAGLEEITEGRIIIGDRVVNDLPPKDRNVAMVKLAKVPKQEREERVRATAKMLDIDQFLDRKPKALSGGQRQRVALGRAIVRNAELFLMDEPLSNLDAKLRVQTRAELIKLHERVQTTTIYVTHDQVEAMTMGDRIAVMSLGVLQQLDTPQNLYDRPANKFVAGFIGSPSMNFVDTTIEQQGGALYARANGFTMRVPDNKANAMQGYIGKSVTLGVRPEHLIERSQADGTAPPDSTIHATVDVVELLGNEIFVYLTTAGQRSENEGIGVGSQTITARMDPDLHLQRGQQIQVTAPMERLHFFDPQSDATIG
jgi:multiple sugar transport system ATP-binding protein